jgi:hypothetical protein
MSGAGPQHPWLPRLNSWLICIKRPLLGRAQPPTGRTLPTQAARVRLCCSRSGFDQCLYGRPLVGISIVDYEPGTRRRSHGPVGGEGGADLLVLGIVGGFAADTQE